MNRPRGGTCVRCSKDPDIELIKECGNGRDAVTSIRALEPDMVFLDVQMPR
jgi:two-component system LytT family response regulator